MKRLISVASASLIVSLGLTACNSGGGNNSGTVPSIGFEVPTEISAVPTNPGNSGSGKPGLQKALLALREAATDADTDYSKAKTVKFVNEHTLEQFDIIEQVLSALAQTHYADTANINQGPYKAMIAWQEERNGVETKTLEPWVVDSAMMIEGSRNVNRVQVWIEEPSDGGGTRLIKAEFKIYQSATRRTDGSYSDYGVWTLNVKFGDSITNFFAASADIDTNGHAVIKVHEKMLEGGPGGSFTREMKAIMNRAETEGHGKVMFPDWESCNQPNCTPTPVEAKYAYNPTHLAVQKGSGTVLFKDRNAVTEMTHRYGMFNSVTGENVMKTKSFGFPVTYTDTDGHPQFAYYGAWQGRHQLWANGGTVPAGTVVTRQDRNPSQTAETYTVSQPFTGTLVKRTLVAASINDLVNIPVETWVNINYNLLYNGAAWVTCPPGGIVFGNPNTCPTGTPVTDFAFLENNPNDTRKFININRWTNSGPILYIRLAAGDSRATSGAGFYTATHGPTPGSFVIGTLYAPANGDMVNANVGGSIYISYNGASWVEKTLLSFDQSTWTPTFDPTGDKPYTLDSTREYYINNQGINYVVKMVSPGVYDTKIELQSVANPVNASSFVTAGTVFKEQWDNSGNASTFSFVTDPASPKFLKLVYATVNTVDQNAGIVSGDVVTQGRWGLVAYDSNNVSTGVQFNWDYPPQGQDWGKLTYLIDANGAYKMLDDPIRLAPITLTNNAGQSKTFSLQFDGWMGGLPDLYRELQKNGFVMTADISGKAVNIPTGTLVTDAVDSTKSYLIKPLEVSQFLNILPSDPGGLDISAANSIDLNSVPNFVEHGMGTMPATTGVKYSEGVLVE
ncbi:MAG: hypothetical protein WAO55_01830 [Candidatus Manganitrophaceae bacterium]